MQIKVSEFLLQPIVAKKKQVEITHLINYTLFYNTHFDQSQNPPDSEYSHNTK